MRRLVSCWLVLWLQALTLDFAHAAVPDESQELSASAQVSHSLHLETAGVTGHVRLNGIPVIRHDFSGSESSGANLNLFLKPGTNRLDVELDLVPDPNFPPFPYVSVRVKRAESVLQEVKLEGKAVPLPFRKSFTFEVPVFPALPVWKASPPPPLDTCRAEITAALNTVAKRVNAGLKKRDVKAVVAGFRPWVEGVRMAEGNDKTRIDLTDVAWTLDSLADQEMPRFPVKPKELILEPVEGTHLFLVRRSDERGVIGFEFPGQNRGASRVLMGKLDGNWELLGSLK